MISRIRPRMEMPGMHDGSSNSTDSSMPHMCSMSMLWNWSTIDACFVSEQWHVRNEVAFAFSIISTRRMARNYDRMLSAKHGSASKTTSAPLRPTLREQLVRGAFYGVQFSAAYVLMLIAMSYNGFAIFAIFL
ncbi:hypothetical protein FRC08_015447 [Ceratobasidium sp. 394]|nr:hypothetical protein FRC08_015447 [Ceratobasidium sp. 394]